MGGERTSKYVRDLFDEKWLLLKTERPGKDPVAMEVRRAVELQLIKEQKPYFHVPGKRASQQICSKIRESYNTNAESEKPLDEQWTMARMNQLKEYEIPAYALPAIVKIWRYAANTNERFTIRQAKWVSRLFSMPCFDNMTLLWFWSNQYSYMERLASIRDECFDSYTADVALFLEKWERETLEITDFRDEPVKFESERLLPPKKDGEYVLELLHAIRHYDPWNYEDEYNKRNQELYNLVRKLPSLKSLGFQEEAIYVYLRWLTSYIVKGPRWNDLSSQDALDVITKLRELVLAEQSFRASEQSKEGLGSIFEMPSQAYSSGMCKLFENVGYEIEHIPESTSNPEIERLRKQLKFQVRKMEDKG